MDKSAHESYVVAETQFFSEGAGPRLSTEQAQKLLQELASNDLFRAKFAANPAAALVELGIPHETVISLDAACLAPTKLASKAEFTEVHKRLGAQAGDWCTQMIVPTLRIGKGKR